MNLPKVVANLVAAQNNHDSSAYAACFSGNAVVFDEGRTHTGPSEIREWIAEADKNYQPVLKPLTYETSGTEGILEAEVSGTFPGSPALLKFHFTLDNERISSLKITG